MSIVVAAFFLFMFFGIPAVFFGVADEKAERPSMARFLEQGMQTMTGHSSGSAALVQMLAVPVCLIFGMLLTAVLGFFLI
jgi:ABC-type sulfate transport system permease subunit